MPVVELFLRRVKLEPRYEGEWVTVYINLKSGFDLTSIDLTSVRLNDTLPVAASETRGDFLGLKFLRRDVHALVDPSRRLTITGKFDDGIHIRGAVRFD
jgi:hypothetical protein